MVLINATILVGLRVSGPRAEEGDMVRETRVLTLTTNSDPSRGAVVPPKFAGTRINPKPCSNPLGFRAAKKQTTP